MDAHEMAFNQKFDFIIGGGILHHLDFVVDTRSSSTLTVRWCLLSLLILTLVAKMVRYLTPHARTVDELPFRMVHLNTVRTYFNLKISAFEFFVVPFEFHFDLFFLTSRTGWQRWHFFSTVRSSVGSLLLSISFGTFCYTEQKVDS